MQSVICATVTRLLVSAFPPGARCFQPLFAVFLATPSPGLLRSRVHPLISSAPSSEYITTFHLSVPRKQQTPPLGFRSSSRHETAESTSRRAFHSSPTFRPRRFSRPRRVTPPQSSRAYFIPQPRTRFTFQGFSPATSQPVSSTDRALLPFATLSYSRVAPTAPDCAARLQGFDPATDPL